MWYQLFDLFCVCVCVCFLAFVRPTLPCGMQEKNSRQGKKQRRWRRRRSMRDGRRGIRTRSTVCRSRTEFSSPCAAPRFGLHSKLDCQSLLHILWLQAQSNIRGESLLPATLYLLNSYQQSISKLGHGNTHVDLISLGLVLLTAFRYHFNRYPV